MPLALTRMLPTEIEANKMVRQTHNGLARSIDDWAAAAAAREAHKKRDNGKRGEKFCVLYAQSYTRIHIEHKSTGCNASKQQ